MHRHTKPLLAAFATACLAAACASTPAPAPAPEPAPPVASFDHTLSGDALFAFGQASVANLSEAGRAELDALAARVLATPGIDMVHVIGHSDRIGKDAANVELSRKRAAAVRDHLVAAGVPAGSVTAVGRGSVEPVATCEGERGQTLIDCLAPNRRVEVRVVAP
ncbi:MULTISPECIES: OmpA family protein [unclassified Luteimonas]|uniref:OmpA family protein n=1 Tax=unclassified Luteimonas TaxID=2629088 RepID=UPI0018F0644F|nr:MULTISPECIES: OmpA family protein [unclassified Luteimonas]MBJ6978135.1 OmpA family protein [Luteimonas sp. MC1895]MBJ6984256.1 OmpA family protein [Luteimonas sp. MC1750]MBJ6985669.1 OmpA family protein [Luteimonas sp. MC1750]QQO06960.1 OmpA family protein [Luteimonas sp. MC1750]